MTRNINVVDDLNAIIRANINKKIIIFFQTINISILYLRTFEQNEISEETTTGEILKAKLLKFNGKMDQETRYAAGPLYFTISPNFMGNSFRAHLIGCK